MDQKGEKVLEVGVEGGGATFFRAWSKEGRWVYHLTYASMDFDNQDNDEWRCDSGPAMHALSETLSSITGVPTWIICYPLFVHPDYRSQVWQEVTKAQAGLSNDQRTDWETALKHAIRRWKELCREKDHGP